MSLDKFIADANKEHGEGSAMTLEDSPAAKIEVVETGIGLIDGAMGIGGFPVGRITEVFGKEGSGKTTLALHAASKVKGGIGYVDMEHALSAERIKTLGVDEKRLVISQPQSGEQGLEMAQMMICSGEFKLVVVDSVAALVPQVEVDKDMGESVMGLHARLMSQAMRKLNPIVGKYGVALVFINQTRANIGVYGGGETTPGGSALRFYSSMRVKLQVKAQIIQNDVKVGNKVKVTVIKNKLATPFKEAMLELNKYGFDETELLLDKLVEEGKIEKSGVFYKIDGKMIGHGAMAAREYLRENPVV